MYHSCGFILDISPVSIDFCVKVPNPTDVILSFQLANFPPLTLQVSPQQAQRSILGGSRFLFGNSISTTFDCHESELRELLSASDKTMSVMLLNSSNINSSSNNNITEFVGSATVDLRSFSNEKNFCSLWGNIRRHVTILTPQQKVIASMELSITLFNTGPLLRSKVIHNNNIRYPSKPLMEIRSSFCVEITVDKIEMSSEYIGTYPDVGFQIHNFPVTILPCPSGLKKRESPGGTNTTINYGVTRLFAFDITPSELVNVLHTGNHVVMLFQEQSEEFKKMAPLSKNHALLRGSSTIELNRLTEIFEVNNGEEGQDKEKQVRE